VRSALFSKEKLKGKFTFSYVLPGKKNDDQTFVLAPLNKSVTTLDFFRIYFFENLYWQHKEWTKIHTKNRSKIKKEKKST